VLFMLVLLRVAGLIRQVQTQSLLLATMARSDALTGMPNRGTWDHELTRLIDDAREHGHELTITLLDLDHFKRYNDTRGHMAGDRLLRELSSVWRSTWPDVVCWPATAERSSPSPSP
jgi:GGDEF domain-containing protein